MISVCIATYNGSRVIREQLESIIPQLGASDEIVISDDASTDNTLSIIADLSCPLIRIVQGPCAGSPQKNFENALREAKGDIIFLSDQDDRWAEDKVAVMLKALKKADCVVSDCYVTDGDMNVTAESFYKHNGTRIGRYYNLICRNGYLGCCMAFRRCVLEKSLPFPKKVPMHDIWIGNIAAFTHTLTFIPEKLIYFRRNDKNASSTAGESRFSLMQKIHFRLYTIWWLIRRL